MNKLLYAPSCAFLFLFTIAMLIPSVYATSPYQTQTYTPTIFSKSIVGGTEVSDGITSANIASQNCASGTCSSINSMNYGFDSSTSGQTFIREILSYDLSSTGITGSQITNMTFKLGGCWHGGNARSCDNTDNPGFNSAGGRLNILIWNGTAWQQLGSTVNLGTSTDSTADNYGTYSMQKTSGFSNGYIQGGKIKIALQTGGITQGSLDVRQVIDYALLAVKYYVPPPDTRPNIIVIMTDDQRWDSVSTMPAVIKLANEGMNFPNSFVNTPLCCPARATFLTGQYAHDHEVWTNHAPGGGATKFVDTSTLPIWLQQSGYSTALVGKYLNDYAVIKEYVPPGWNDWHAIVPPMSYMYKFNDNGVVSPSYGTTAADYSTDVIRDKSLNFIHTANRPFFLWMTPTAPHIDPSKYATPAQRHLSSCTIDTFRPASYNEADVSDKPFWVKRLPTMETSPSLSGTTNSGINYVDRMRITQICALKAVDEALTSIENELGPELDNTIIIFTSDNGMTWGEHRWYYKSCEFEECIRVPLIIRYPPLIAHGQVSNQIVQQMDLTSTIVDIANVTPPITLKGKSLVPLFSNPNAPLHDDILIEQRVDDSVSAYSESFEGVRTPQYKYIELNDTAGRGFPQENEFYDLTSDPFELNNKINDPSYADIINQLALRLQELKLQ